MPLTNNNSVRCNRMGCGNQGNFMLWVIDSSRHGGGRFKCNNMPKLNFFANTIFNGSKTSINISFRLMFHHFIRGDTVVEASNSCGVCWRTADNHYNLCRMVIHDF